MEAKSDGFSAHGGQGADGRAAALGLPPDGGDSDAAAAAPPVPAPRKEFSGTLYAPGTFPRSTPSAPPIYRVAGGGRRPQECLDVDARLRAATSSRELLALLREALPRFDVGSAVVAFTTAAKLDNGQEMASLDHSPAWAALQERVVDCAPQLEPRGMSMVAYAAARFMWGEPRLLAALAAAGARRAPDFGATDVAKGCWAFAKLRYVDEAPAADFWRAASREAPRTVRSARFVDVSMMAWAFAMVGRGHGQGENRSALFAEIALATRAALETLPPRSLASISWACAKVGHRDDGLFRDVARRALAAVEDFGAHDVAAFVWGFSAAGVEERRLYEALASHLVAAGVARKLSPPLAAELAWGFAAAGVFPAPLFAELESLCISQLWQLETEDVAGFAWSFASAGCREAEVWRAIRSYAERFAGRLHHSEKDVLAWALGEAGCGPLPGPRPAAAQGLALGGTFRVERERR